MKNLSIPTTFLVSGVFKIEKDTLQDAIQEVEEQTGGTVSVNSFQSISQNIWNWEFPLHMDKATSVDALYYMAVEAGNQHIFNLMQSLGIDRAKGVGILLNKEHDHVSYSEAKHIPLKPIQRFKNPWSILRKAEACLLELDGHQ